MYISQKSSHKPRKDFQIYAPKEIGSVFIELLILNMQNHLIRTFYKHPPMQHFQFNDDFIIPPLNKLKTENKATIMAGEFNLNIINYTQVRGVHQFLKTFLSNNFIPQITLPTDNHDHKCSSGNITTSVSDHLSHFLIIEKRKQTPLRKDVKISFRSFQNFNETDFQNELNSLGWSLVTKTFNLKSFYVF